MEEKQNWISNTRYEQLTVGNKKIDIYPSKSPDCPIIYLNTVSAESEAIWRTLEKMNCPKFSLIAISGLEWHHDMAPWDIPSISKNNTPCTGGADDYLRLLLEEIIPQAEKIILGNPSWRGLAGYSLAGLFAVYAMYKTDIFLRVASISGSLWFPDFKEYAMSHELKKKPEHLYFSLGNKECKIRNMYLKTVQSNTEELVAFYQNQQINTKFQLNSGNHFTEPINRSAKGIQWLLS